MVDFARSLVYETSGLLTIHFGISFSDFLGGLPLYKVHFDLQYFLIWPFWPHLWQVISDLADEPPPETLPFPLWRILKSTCFKVLLIEWSTETVYALRLLFAGSRLPPIWTHNIVVLSRSLLYKRLIVYELLLWYDIHVTHKKFLDQLCNILVLLNRPKTEYGAIIIFKYASDVP